MITKCSECIHWIPEENSDFGQCRAKAPEPKIVTKEVGSFIGPYNYRVVWGYTSGTTGGCNEGVSGKRIQPREEMKDQTEVRETKKPDNPPTPKSFDQQVEAMRKKNG